MSDEQDTPAAVVPYEGPPAPAEIAGPPAPDRSGVSDAQVGYVFYDARGAIEQSGFMALGPLQRLAAATGRRCLVLTEPPPEILTVDLPYFVEERLGLVRKTPSPARLRGRTLSGLPVPCTIEVFHPATGVDRYPVEVPELDLSFEHPGTYRVRVVSVPHLPAEFEVAVDG